MIMGTEKPTAWQRFQENYGTNETVELGFKTIKCKTRKLIELTDLYN